MALPGDNSMLSVLAHAAMKGAGPVKTSNVDPLTGGKKVFIPIKNFGPNPYGDPPSRSLQSVATTMPGLPDYKAPVPGTKEPIQSMPGLPDYKSLNLPDFSGSFDISSLPNGPLRAYLSKLYYQQNTPGPTTAQEIAAQRAKILASENGTPTVAPAQPPDQTSAPQGGVPPAEAVWINSLLKGAGNNLTPQQFSPPSYTQPQQIPEIQNPGGGQASGQILQAIQNSSSPQSLQSYIDAAGPIAGSEIQNQLRALYLQGIQGQNTILDYNQGTQGALGQIGKQVAGNYGAAENVQDQISRAIQSGLGGMNPSGENANIAGTAGAPGPQQQALRNEGATGFTRAGKVLGGVGELGVGNLAAQAADAKSFTDTLPALTRIQGGQALASFLSGNQTALASLLDKNQSERTKLGLALMSGDQKKLGDEINLYGKVTGNELGTARINAGIDAHNADNARIAAQNNAQNYLADIRAATSAEQAAISKGRYIESLVKAEYPTSGQKATATDASSLDKQFKQAFGFTQGTAYRAQTGKTSVSGQPVTVTKYHNYNAATYDTIVNRIVNNSNGKYTKAFVQQAAAGYVNIGYGGAKGGVGARPFDDGMVEQLKANHVPAVINEGKGGVPYLTLDQYHVLRGTGYSAFTDTLKLIPGKDKQGHIVWGWYIPALK